MGLLFNCPRENSYEGPTADTQTAPGCRRSVAKSGCRILLGKSEELWIRTITWTCLWETALSEKSQSHKVMYHMIPFMVLKLTTLQKWKTDRRLPEVKMGGAGRGMVERGHRRVLWQGNWSVHWLQWWLHVSTLVIKWHKTRYTHTHAWPHVK